MKKRVLIFKRENIVSCVGVPFRTLVWNYICRVLAGKPESGEKEV